MKKTHVKPPAGIMRRQDFAHKKHSQMAMRCTKEEFLWNSFITQHSRAS